MFLILFLDHDTECVFNFQNMWEQNGTWKDYQNHH